jgi:hypothetical protein
MSRKKKGPRRPGPAVTPPPVSVPTPPPAGPVPSAAARPLPAFRPQAKTLDDVADRLAANRHRTDAPRSLPRVVARWAAIAGLVVMAGVVAWLAASADYLPAILLTVGISALGALARWLFADPDD